MQIKKVLIGVLCAYCALNTPDSFAQGKPDDIPVPPVIPERPEIKRALERAERNSERAIRQAEAALSKVKLRTRDVHSRQFRGAENASKNRKDNFQTEANQNAANSAAQITLRKEVEINPFERVIEREWLLMLGSNDLEQLKKTNADIINYVVRSKELGAFKQSILTLKVPEILDNFKKLNEQMPNGINYKLDRQHVYQVSTDNNSATEPQELYKSTLVCQSPHKSIGVIDTDFNKKHPKLIQAINQGRLKSHQLEAVGEYSPADHGTAVIGLFASERSENSTVLIDEAHIQHVSAFYSKEDGTYRTTAELLLEAIDYLVTEKVDVINMSLSGPPNELFNAALNAAHKSNVIIVGAVGNEGPYAPPRYPAANENVIAVTAVDAKQNIYKWAVQGDHIDFASVGVDVPVLSLKGVEERSGTSLAAPVITAYAACLSGKSSADIRRELEAISKDLGAPGKDPVFGVGVIHPILN